MKISSIFYNIGKKINKIATVVNDIESISTGDPVIIRKRFNNKLKNKISNKISRKIYNKIK